MNRRLAKIFDASGLTPSDILKALFDEGHDAYTIGGYVKIKAKMDCGKCPLNKRCLKMFQIQPARKNQCLDIITSYVFKKKFILPLPKKVEKELLKAEFAPIDDFYVGNVIKKAYYSLSQDGINICLFPKSSDWTIHVRAKDYFYVKYDFQLNQLNEIIELAEKEYMITMNERIEGLSNDQIPSSIPDILKDGDEFLKNFRLIKGKISKARFV